MDIKKFSALQLKRTKQFHRIHFLSQCLHRNHFPSFLSLHHRLPDPPRNSNNIIKSCKKALLRAYLDDAHRVLASMDATLLHLHLDLSSQLHPVIFDLILTKIHSRNSNLLDRLNLISSRKLPIPPTPQKPLSNSPPSVLNLSSYPLSDLDLQVLSKGPNFAITPSTVPISALIANIETNIHGLNEIDKQEVRFLAIKNFRKPVRSLPKNLTKEEKTALQHLKSNPNLIILPADKGNSLVLFDKKDYDHKLEVLTQDSIYIPIKKDPTKKINNRVRNALKSCKFLPKPQDLFNPTPFSPYLYGLPKIHKPNTPLRPIVSATSSPTHLLARFLHRKFSLLPPSSSYSIKEPSDIIQPLLNLPTSVTFFSLDVVSLFTNIPLQETLDIIESLLPSTYSPEESTELMSLLNLVSQNNYFAVNNSFFQQIDGTPMGSPISPILANIFMQHLESRAISSAPLKPLLYRRYVDDCLIAWPHPQDTIQSFLTHMNSQHPKIQFTIEFEKDNKLPFLDILILKQPNGIQTTTYCKPTHTGKYLHPNSCHTTSHKKAFLRSLVRRAITHCSTHDLRNRELQRIKVIAQNHGFHPSLVTHVLKELYAPKNKPDTTNPKIFLPLIPSITDSTFQHTLHKHNFNVTHLPGQKLKHFFNNHRPQKDPLDSAGVYKINCSNCEKSYIGQTKRPIKTRIKEHRSSIKSLNPSAISLHAIESLHTPDWNNVLKIDNNKNWHQRLWLEAIHITANQPHTVNQVEGLSIPPIWKTFIHSQAHKIKHKYSSNQLHLPSTSNSQFPP